MLPAALQQIIALKLTELQLLGSLEARTSSSFEYAARNAMVCL